MMCQKTLKKYKSNEISNEIMGKRIPVKVSIREFSFETVVKGIKRGDKYKIYRVTLPKEYAEKFEGKKVLVTVKVIDD